MKIISLGWGVQSFTLAAMVALGELEPIDYAIHADTTHESQLTYQFADRWRDWLKERGVEVVTVQPSKTKVEAFNNYGGIFIPAFTRSDKGSYGQLRRQCTGDWKIAPMRRWIQEHRNNEPVEQWIGISWDESQRMKVSDVKYITHQWPLLDKKMTRADCKNWLTSHNLEIPPRSACTFCPFHSTSEWRRIKDTPSDWKSAIEHDRAIRKGRPPFDLFVHPSRKPLEEVDFRTAEEKGQLSLWDNECTGMCGV
jgi:3'-phosphoadenosine 5'-phosphosulfate sulfotransferase (PAPS reductase)/FAD synthetase